MRNQLTDLDELLQQVKNRNSKEYLREAITSYRAGAYRAAVTSTWISICVDLIEKVKELSINNDAAAKEIENRLNGIQPHEIKSMLDFENDILRIAQEDLGIISLIEKTHLERIKQDRNICAHPTFSVDGVQFIPSPEIARAHIVQAATYLLIQTPIKGKVFLGNLYDLITGESFPEDQEKAFKVLKSDQYLGRVKDSVIRNLIIILFKRLFKDESSLPVSLLKKITSALSAINRISPKDYAEVCGEKLIGILASSNDDQIKRIIYTLTYNPGLWLYVEDAVKHRIEKTIESMNVNDLISYQVAKTAELISEMNNYFQDSIQGVSRNEMNTLLKDSVSSVLLDRAIDVFIESGSFASAYNNGVQILLKYTDYITDISLKIVFEGAKKNSNYNINQILNAGGISEFFAMLYSGTQNKNVREHAKLWLDFRNEINALEYDYPDLDGFMEADGIIKLDGGFNS